MLNPAKKEVFLYYIRKTVMILVFMQFDLDYFRNRYLDINFFQTTNSKLKTDSPLIEANVRLVGSSQSMADSTAAAAAAQQQEGGTPNLSQHTPSLVSNILRLRIVMFMRICVV